MGKQLSKHHQIECFRKDVLHNSSSYKTFSCVTGPIVWCYERLKNFKDTKNPQQKLPLEASATYSKLEFQALSIVVLLFYALFNNKWT